MTNETIRRHLVDAIQELTRLLEVCEESNQRFAIRIKIRELFHKLDRVIIASLNAQSPQFAEAITALKALTKEAKKARTNLNRVASTLKKATKALGKVEKLIKGVAGVLAIL